MSFLEKFDKEFASKLANRTGTFRRIFEELENTDRDYYIIVETGCARSSSGWAGDGMSTILFDEFVNYYDGRVFSIDIDPVACKTANNMTSMKTTTYNQDSVDFLQMFDLKDEIALLYLDSFDIDFNKPMPSAKHHLKEFAVTFACLKPGTIIAVDDQKGKVGKGMLVASLLEDLGYKRFIDDYQIGWIL